MPLRSIRRNVYCANLWSEIWNYALIITQRGYHFEDLLRQYVDLIGEWIDILEPDDLTISMHSCRGSYRCMWLAQGCCHRVAQVLFSDINTHCHFLGIRLRKSRQYWAVEISGAKQNLFVWDWLLVKRRSLKIKMRSLRWLMNLLNLFFWRGCVSARSVDSHPLKHIHLRSPT
jgi:hypothetical protein